MKRSELAEFFNEELCCISLSETTKDKALEEMVDLFVKNDFIRNREIVLQMLRQRESLGSTGIGHGVAIPHGRTTAAPNVLIAFGKSEQGIDFDAIDGKPVYLIFMIIAPPHEVSNLYLPILGSLVTILKDSKNRKKLRKCSSFADTLVVIRGDEDDG
jgi:mannitol/fructose-specific phosphotransferase system IIA component (Ntr-type)